jgi:thiamine kinase-like enzyme
VLEPIVERLWPGREAVVEPLGGGITNRNFKVWVGGEILVLRIGGKDTRLLGIDRRAELAAAVAAARAGVGPDVVRFVEPEGYLVTRFVEGRPVEPAELRRPPLLGEAAALLRKVHEGEWLPGRFDSFRVVEVYAKTARELGVSLPAGHAAAAELAGRIERVRGRQLLWPCHNDLLSANLIHDWKRLWIVDWEYAGIGDCFFDLANLAANNGFSPDDDLALLEAYFGAVREEDERALVLMRFMSDFREAMWGVVQQGLSELDFDFRAYADEHFERLERTASERRFQQALEAGPPRPSPPR